MTAIDPLDNWIVPKSITEWGKSNAPHSSNVWFNYITDNIHPDIVSIIIRLLIPSFIEHEGGVFLNDQFSVESFNKWKQKSENISEIENFMNHQHVYDLFAVNDDVTDESFEQVARLMMQTLKLSLSVSFPNRTFKVYLSSTDDDYGPTVSFYSLESE